MDYKSSVSGSGAGGGHTHGGGPTSRNGAHLHGSGPTGGGGAHDHATGDDGGHEHTIALGGVHAHTVTGVIYLTLFKKLAFTALAVVYDGNHTHPNPDTGSGSSHSHTNPATGGPSSTTSVVQDLDYGEVCGGAGGSCVSGTDPADVASPGHTHTQGDTGDESSHTHSQGSTQSDGYHGHSLSATTDNFVYNVEGSTDLWTSSQHDGHPHGETYEIDHTHGVTYEDSHGHTVPDSSTEPDHEHAGGDTSTEPDHDHSVIYSIHYIPGGTTLELYVGDELVGNNYVGDQSGINITGWITTGSNSITLKPVVGDNVKGRAKLSATATVFLENLK